MDKLNKKRRSYNMSRIRSKDTQPELLVRRMLFMMGYRYRLHVAELPGKPDLVFPRRKKVIFIHGCFWHQHAGCKRSILPKSNLAYWGPKLAGNLKRDKKHITALRKLGWKVLVLRECRLKNLEATARRADKFLRTPHTAKKNDLRTKKAVHL